MTQNLKVENDNDKKKSTCLLFEFVDPENADVSSHVFDYNTYPECMKRDKTCVYFEVYEVVE